jgi:hypothetical protein
VHDSGFKTVRSPVRCFKTIQKGNLTRQLVGRQEPRARCYGTSLCTHRTAGRVKFKCPSQELPRTHEARRHSNTRLQGRPPLPWCGTLDACTPLPGSPSRRRRAAVTLEFRGNQRSDTRARSRLDGTQPLLLQQLAVRRPPSAAGGMGEWTTTPERARVPDKCERRRRLDSPRQAAVCARSRARGGSYRDEALPFYLSVYRARGASFSRPVCAAITVNFTDGRIWINRSRIENNA